MKYKVMCNNEALKMNREPDDIYHNVDGYLVFDKPYTEFDSVLSATRAVERTIVYAIAHGYEDHWTIPHKGYYVIPVAEKESA